MDLQSLRSHYGVLHELNTSGMFRVALELPGLRPTLRVLADTELEQIYSLRGYGLTMESMVISSALVSFAGFPVPPDPELRMQLAEMLVKRCPTDFLLRMTNAYLRSSSKVRNSYPVVEGYLNTDSSRRLWQVRKVFPNPFSYQATGVYGSDQYPLLQCQISWLSWNASKDVDERRRWENQLSIVAMAGTAHKAVQDHFNKEERIREHEEDERATIVRAGSRSDLAREVRERDGWATDLNTTEELLEQFRKMLAGEKDRHDLVVEAHFREIREQAKREAEEAAEKSRLAAEAAERARQEAEKNKHKPPREQKLRSFSDKQMRDNNLIRRVGRPMG